MRIINKTPKAWGRLVMYCFWASIIMITIHMQIQHFLNVSTFNSLFNGITAGITFGSLAFVNAQGLSNISLKRIYKAVSIS